VEIWTKVRCLAHGGEHRGVVVSKLSDGWFGVAWDRQDELLERSRAEWMASRERLAEADGLIMTPADAIEADR
jgi:hypothetical protein